MTSHTEVNEGGGGGVNKERGANEDDKKLNIHHYTCLQHYYRFALKAVFWYTPSLLFTAAEGFGSTGGPLSSKVVPFAFGFFFFGAGADPFLALKLKFWYSL